MNDEKLIELVRYHPVLYDLSNPKYMDTDFKNTVWNKIGEEIETTGQSCKSRWANIRDNFRKSLKKNKPVSGQKSKPVKFYRYSEQLSFLIKYFNEREPRSNIGDEGRSQVMSGDEEETHTTEHNEAEQLAIQVDSPVIKQPQCHAIPRHTPTLTSSSRYSTQNKKRKLSLQVKSPPKTAAATVIEYLIKEKERASSLSTPPPDPVDAFLSGIAPALKNLSPHDWHYAKADIFSVVQKYELKMLMGEEQSAESSTFSHYCTSRYSGPSSPAESCN